MTETMNLFWSQLRNPKLREKEKENNVTHAFLVTLSEDKNFLNYLLKKLNIKTLNKKSMEVFFQVDRKKYGRKVSEKLNKYLLFIKSETNENEINKDKDEEKIKDIPDGLIIDKNTAILIESKVSATKDNSQINRYNNNFFEGQGKIILTTWEKIYNHLSSYRNLKRTKIPIANFLIENLKEYLEVIHLSGFEGIPFFKEEYNKEDAAYILTNLVGELTKQNWFRKYQFKLSDRPKTNNWTYWYNKNITENNPRNFPHCSIYIFKDIFGIECNFHKKDIKKILNDDMLFKQFKNFLHKLSKNPDFYFHAEHYRLLQNKEESVGARQGANFSVIDFAIQLKRFINKHKKNWDIQLRNYLNLLTHEEIKQFSVFKKVYYTDKSHESLCDPKKAFDFIEKTMDEVIDFYEFIYSIYRR